MIVNARDSKQFMQLKAGQAFWLRGVLYMKIDLMRGHHERAVDLRDGSVKEFGGVEETIPVEAKVTAG